MPFSTDGFEPTWCSTGEEAKKSLSKERYALVLLDVGLPDANGFELCRELRAISDVPIIFLTARSDEVDRIVGLEIGADDYISKPFSPRELSARIRAVLRRAKRPVAEEQAGSGLPFSIDQQRKVISYFDKPLELSRYEYRILEILISRPGWVFSREKLMGLAWDDPLSSLERTVDAHIKTLRAKLSAISSEREAIITHRGTGYALREDW